SSLKEGNLKPLNWEFAAEEVGFEPTDPCRSHDFQSCRFGRSRTPPKSRSTLSLHLLALSRAVAGFCATGDREPSQGRKAAALSGLACVPQVTWLLRTPAPAPFRCKQAPEFVPSAAVGSAAKSYGRTGVHLQPLYRRCR